MYEVSTSVTRITGGTLGTCRDGAEWDREDEECDALAEDLNDEPLLDAWKLLLLRKLDPPPGRAWAALAASTPQSPTATTPKARLT
jgi:hypothetical protein